jgi:hypothetical protein
MSPFSVHLEGFLFGAAGVATVVLALGLAIGEAMRRSRANAARWAASGAAPVLSSPRDHVPALACFLVGAAALVVGPFGRSEPADYAQGTLLDGVFWLVPAMGLALWALARSMLRPPEPRARVGKNKPPS